MPHCFALYRKGEKEIHHLHRVDEELAAHLGIEVDEKRWTANWYDTIGLLLAIGKSFEEIRDIYRKEVPEDNLAIKVIDFLAENYDVQAWREYGRGR